MWWTKGHRNCFSKRYCDLSMRNAICVTKRKKTARSFSFKILKFLKKFKIFVMMISREDNQTYYLRWQCLICALKSNFHNEFKNNEEFFRQFCFQKWQQRLISYFFPLSKYSTLNDDTWSHYWIRQRYYCEKVNDKKHALEIKRDFWLEKKIC